MLGGACWCVGRGAGLTRPRPWMAGALPQLWAASSSTSHTRPPAPTRHPTRARARVAWVVAAGVPRERPPQATGAGGPGGAGGGVGAWGQGWRERSARSVGKPVMAAAQGVPRDRTSPLGPPPEGTPLGEVGGRPATSQMDTATRHRPGSRDREARRHQGNHSQTFANTVGQECETRAHAHPIHCSSDADKHIHSLKARREHE